jgi:hypothetical protein
VTFGGRSQRAALNAGVQAFPNVVGLIFVDHSTGLRRFIEQKASV